MTEVINPGSAAYRD